MSNYYKSANVTGAKKIIISTKRINSIETIETTESTGQLSGAETLENELGAELVAKKKQLKQLEEEINDLAEKKAEAEVEIERMFANAEEEIASWWTKQQKELEQLGQQVREMSTQEGYNQGHQQALSEWAQKLSEAENVLQTAFSEKQKIIQEAEPFLLSLSVKIAEKIVRQHLEREDSGWLEMIRSELALIRDRGEITLEVPASEYQNFLPYKDELTNIVPAEVELKIVPHRSSTRSGCLIHTPSGSYDVTIDSQLAEIKKQLLSLYEEQAT